EGKKELAPPLLLFRRDRVAQRLGARARLGGVSEGADIVELCVAKELAQVGKLFLALSGEADDEGRADRDVRDFLPHSFDHSQISSAGSPSPHRSENRPRDVLKRDVEVREEATLARHEVEHRIVEGLGVRVEKPDPWKGSLHKEPLDQPCKALAPEAQIL